MSHTSQPPRQALYELQQEMQRHEEKDTDD